MLNRQEAHELIRTDADPSREQALEAIRAEVDLGGEAVEVGLVAMVALEIANCATNDLKIAV